MRREGSVREMNRASEGGIGKGWTWIFVQGAASS